MVKKTKKSQIKIKSNEPKSNEPKLSKLKSVKLKSKLKNAYYFGDLKKEKIKDTPVYGWPGP